MARSERLIDAQFHQDPYGARTLMLASDVGNRMHAWDLPTVRFEGARIRPDRESTRDIHDDK